MLVSIFEMLDFVLNIAAISAFRLTREEQGRAVKEVNEVKKVAE